jgi:hypothetical protein
MLIQGDIIFDITVARLKCIIFVALNSEKILYKIDIKNSRPAYLMAGKNSMCHLSVNKIFK